eukprot:TRINITY_DN6997_c0_g1_i1.p1 TRINITY_DN6997_c0_g1~~TRINITY_DN6997_c0_g1_i1.p1  ORF type:complete len:177 (-),score=23.33 TRINITY_DN6997_c0_g1_i1:186-689(-)
MLWLQATARRGGGRPALWTHCRAYVVRKPVGHGRKAQQSPISPSDVDFTALASQTPSAEQSDWKGTGETWLMHHAKLFGFLHVILFGNMLALAYFGLRLEFVSPEECSRLMDDIPWSRLFAYRDPDFRFARNWDSALLLTKGAEPVRFCLAVTTFPLLAWLNRRRRR